LPCTCGRCPQLPGTRSTSVYVPIRRDAGDRFTPPPQMIPTLSHQSAFVPIQRRLPGSGRSRSPMGLRESTVAGTGRRTRHRVRGRRAPRGPPAGRGRTGDGEPEAHESTSRASGEAYARAADRRILGFTLTDFPFPLRGPVSGHIRRLRTGATGGAPIARAPAGPSVRAVAPIPFERAAPIRLKPLGTAASPGIPYAYPSRPVPRLPELGFERSHPLFPGPWKARGKHLAGHRRGSFPAGECAHRRTPVSHPERHSRPALSVSDPDIRPSPHPGRLREPRRRAAPSAGSFPLPGQAPGGPP
jgi:hypothetical protein